MNRHSIPEKLAILCREKGKDSGVNLEKLAAFMGIPCLTSRLDDQGSRGCSLNMSTLMSAPVIAASSDALYDALGTGNPPAIKDGVLKSTEAIFVCDFSGGTKDELVLRYLTDGALLSVEPVESLESMLSMSADFQDVGKQLTGQSFKIKRTAPIFTFNLGPTAAGTRVLATVGGRPFLLQLSMGKTSVFIAGCKIADIEATVPSGTTALAEFPSLMPFMLFLCYVFKERCWHNDAPKACFIIDDPLLTEVYGFLDYKKLLDVMDRSIFSASIAFIPWNYDRSGPRVADLFLKRSERLSLSVHGCDHIHAEFGTRDEQALRWRAWKALDRMKEQETLTGLPFDKVMIFPQGIFSISAMGALSSSGFLAAVNTTPYPVDGSDGVLTLRDLLDVAVERFSNFPLFVRHYPNDIAEFAFDLFLGKPALLVEHHRYFKNGYTILADFVGKLKALEEKLGWTNLAAICSQTCLKRVAENGETQLKFYTDRFRLQNDTDQTQNYRLFRRVMSEKPLARVIVNGRYADCDQAADYLRIPVSLDPGQKAEVSIDRGHLDTGKIYFKQRPMYNTMVFIRRGLSEFRDNYVDTHRRLSGIASRARNLLSKTKRNVLRKRSN